MLYVHTSYATGSTPILWICYEQTRIKMSFSISLRSCPALSWSCPVLSYHQSLGHQVIFYQSQVSFKARNLRSSSTFLPLPWASPDLPWSSPAVSSPWEASKLDFPDMGFVFVYDSCHAILWTFCPPFSSFLNHNTCSSRRIVFIKFTT